MAQRKILLFPSTFGKTPDSLKLVRVLSKAGMEPVFLPDSIVESEWENSLKNSDIILISGDKHSDKWENELEFLKNKVSNFEKETVVWCTPDYVQKLKSTDKSGKLENLKRLFPHQHFVMYSSLIKLADDLRNIKTGVQADTSGKKFDVTVIANETDRQMLEKATILIDGVLSINPIIVDISTDADYAKLCSEGIAQSKMCVIMSAQASDWAVHFTQQIWKITGGASSEVPMLVIFDQQFNKRSDIQLQVPNVSVMVTDETLAGLEIKVYFDKLNAQIS